MFGLESRWLCYYLGGGAPKLTFLENRDSLWQASFFAIFWEFGSSGSVKFLERYRKIESDDEVWKVVRFNASLWTSITRFFCNLRS